MLDRRQEVAFPQSRHLAGPVALRPASARSLISSVGHTPLIELRRISGEVAPVQIAVKAEWVNPGGSVKDRAALSMLLDGRRSGRLTRDKIVIDATSGNTGIAYAMFGAALGYRVRLVVPGNLGEMHRRILRAYGAELVCTSAQEGSDGAIREAQRLAEQSPETYFYPDQYSNPANWKAHYEHTGPEIIRQTGGRITHFVSAMGTSGTFTGVTRRMRREMPHVKCYSAQPASGFHGLEGLKHMPTAIVPAIYDEQLADGNLWIETEDAYRMVRRLAREEGMLVGISSGANVVASLQVAREQAEAGQGGVIVTVFCDAADKYLSEHFWDEE